MGDVLVYIEQRDGKIHGSVPEVLGRGKELAAQIGGSLRAAVIGAMDDSVPTDLGSYGVERAIQVTGADLDPYLQENHGDALRQAADEVQPEIILLAASLTGKDLAPRVATLLNTDLAQDVVAVDVDDDGLAVRRPMYAGKSFAVVKLLSKPFVASIRPKAYPVPETGPAGPVETTRIEFRPEGDYRKKIVEINKTAGERIGLIEADVIVSGGRGMKAPENYRIIEELADVLKAAVGASRAAVDAGWREHSDQVGQTGKVVSPQLYVACGISGAVQHLAGMSTSKCIVAINRDPDAPIFQIADYGIVGDLFEVVPALTKAIKEGS